jgi:hypothetical protein
VAFAKYTAKPAGYGANAMALPVAVGGIGAWIRDSDGVAAAAIDALASIGGSPAGSGTAAAPITGLKDAAATPAGVGAMVSSVKARGTIAATIRIGFQPSADDILFTLMDSAGTVDGLSLRQALRVMMAVLAGKVSGAGSNTPAFRSVNDSKTRVAAVTDASGNRTSVTVDGA